MKNLKFLQLAVCLIALFALTAHSSWAQTTVTLPQACDCPTGGGGDTDGDGVPDADDLCPGTPSGTAVDADGCAVGDFRAGYVFCSGTPTVVQDVTSPTGKIWMDRNLGASQVATSSTDAAAYGDLFQWGRFADGHQCRTSLTTSYNASKPVPNEGHPWYGLFITEDVNPKDWLVHQDDNLWQGVGGVNNPCPSGYRLPTDAELNTERLSFSTNNAAGAFASPLKLTMAGYRNVVDGSLQNVGNSGFYWSSTVINGQAWYLRVYVGAEITTFLRGLGCSVRCIKD